MTRLWVKQLARAADASPGAVRHYVRIGLLTPVRDSNNGYHLFVLSDVMRFRFIYRAKYLGYTLNEIRQIFEESDKGLSPCPLVRQIIARRITENGHELEQAMLLQKRMERALAQQKGRS
jgi:MerR family transcriptional regulator, Zn(II)-responsive regulator of zntA